MYVWCSGRTAVVSEMNNGLPFFYKMVGAGEPFATWLWPVSSRPRANLRSKKSEDAGEALIDDRMTDRQNRRTKEESLANRMIPNANALRSDFFRIL